MARSVPLLLSLFLTFAFAVASLGVLINAFVKSNDEANYVQTVAPKGTIVNIGDDGEYSTVMVKKKRTLLIQLLDILTTGKVSSAIQAVLILLSLLSLAALSITRFSSPKAFLLLGALLAFSTVWLLATTIAFTVIFATKSAKITATAGGVVIPQNIISVIQASLGLTPVYKELGYRMSFVIIMRKFYSMPIQFARPPLFRGSPSYSLLFLQF